MTRKYKIKSGEMGSDRLWSIVADDGEVVAMMHGPMSGAACLAAAEALNKGFEWDGWTSRLSDLLVREPEA